MQIKKIAFIGATGMLGKPVAEKLADSGFEVSALVRDESKAREMLSEKIRIIKGDLQDKDSLRDVINEADAVYLNVSVLPSEKKANFHPETDGIANIISVVKESGDKRIYYLSSLIHSYESDWWALKLKKKAVEIIKESGVRYTIFYPSTFMETLGVLTQGKKLMLIGKHKYKSWFIAVSDFTGQVVKAMKNSSDGNEEYAIQGPEGLTMTEAGEKYVRAYKKEKLKVSVLPMGLVRFIGTFVPKFGYGAGLMDVINNYEEKFSAEKTWKELGEPKTTVEEFARRQ